MLLSVLENYYNSCTIVHLLKVLNCHFLSSCWIFRIFLFYIIIRNFYLFWILALGILQKPCYIHPTHHLSTWPSLWGCLNALYSFTLIPPRSLLLSPSAVDLALRKERKKRKKREKAKRRKCSNCYNQVTYLYLCLYILFSLLLLWMNSLCFCWRTFLPLVHLLKHTAPGIFLCLGHFNFPSWLNYPESTQTFCYFSHLEKKKSQYHILCLPYLLSFRGKLLSVLYKLPSVPFFPVSWLLPN